jgi:hypothetical protein
MATDSAPGEMHTTPSPSPTWSLPITPEVNVSQATGPGASDVSTEAGSDQRAPRRSRGSFGTPTRGKKRRAPAPPPPPAPSTRLLPLPPPQPSLPSPREIPRIPSPRTPSPFRGSQSTPIEISSDESEQELDASTAQTTPNPSPTPQEKQLKTPPVNPTAVRPASESRTVSAPARFAGPGGGGGRARPRRAQDIDGDIEAQIRNPMKPSKRDRKLGYVYVVRAEHIADAKVLIKIGFTAEVSVDKRLRSIISADCAATIRLLPSSEASPEHVRVLVFYKQVEKLAHRELDNFRHDFVCGCGKAHREFFAVDEAVGQRVVDRWARLSALRPWTRDGALTDEWRFYVDRFGGRKHGRPSGEQLKKTDEHVGRHQRWESFLASGRSGWHRHRAGVLLREMWTHRWQLWSVALAFLLVALTPSWPTFSLLVVTAGGVCGEPSARDAVVDLASLVRDVAAHYSSTPISTADKDDEVEETYGKGDGLDIWADSETGDGEPDEENQEEGEEKEKDDEDATLSASPS